VTRIRPHIPEQTPPETDEWIVQRNLNLPMLRKTREAVGSPAAEMAWSNVHPPP